MSNLDYQSGLGAGYAQARAARREVDQWANHAQALQQRLAEANESALFKQVAFDANDLVLKLALEELKKANPTSPLLDKSNRDMLRQRHIAGALGTKGYKIDVATGRVLSRPR